MRAYWNDTHIKEVIMSFGYIGAIARINLTNMTVDIEHPGDEYYRQFLGGRNIVSNVLLRELNGDVDPLSPNNKIVVATSVFTGTTIPGSSRFSVGAKSPLTSGYGESEAGGWFGPELKRAGFDALIIEGRSEKLVYIWITDDQVEIVPAEDLRGQETGAVEDIIKGGRDDKNIRILQCGPAGENLVKFAALTNELRHWCGRTGMGAVFGSKNLRAVAVRGRKKVAVLDQNRITEFARWFASSVDKHPGLKYNKKLGTSKGMLPLNEMGLVPTRNFRKGAFDHPEKLSGEYMYEHLLKKNESCFACPVNCKRVVEYETDAFSVDGRFGGPEWETVGSLGSNCEVGSMEVVGKANELCNRYGLDTISTGVTIAWAMEARERGLLSQNDTDGVDLSFGNGEALLQMIEKIAFRDGFGDTLAEGSYRAGLRIGEGAEKFSMTSKKQEFPAHEPRGKWGVALGYAVSATGGDHLIAAHDTWFENETNPDEELWFIDMSDLSYFGFDKPMKAASLSTEKVRLFHHLEMMWSLNNVLDLCIFVSVPEYRMMTLDHMSELLEAVTGWKISKWEMMKIAEKGINMMRLFNIKHGLSAADDILPDRLFEPLENGAHEGFAIDREEFEKAKITYYQMRGWSNAGVPTFGKFAELGIDDVYKKAGIS